MADEGKIPVLLSPSQLAIINNALNEVCNGVHIDDCDFYTRLGVTRDEARMVLNLIHDLWKANE